MPPSEFKEETRKSSRGANQAILRINPGYSTCPVSISREITSTRCRMLDRRLNSVNDDPGENRCRHQGSDARKRSRQIVGPENGEIGVDEYGHREAWGRG